MVLQFGVYINDVPAAVLHGAFIVDVIHGDILVGTLDEFLDLLIAELDTLLCLDRGNEA
jgi:hypothetical protein